MSIEPSLTWFLSLLKSQFWPILNDWWWLFLIVECFWLSKAALFLWYQWRKEVFDAKENEPRVFLEIKIPEEVLEPIKAMETVITGFWQTYQFPNWYEKWWRGQDVTSFTLEIAGIDGVPHFYIRAPKKFQPVLETHIYSQYPLAEIFETEDYTKNVPQDMPNAEWDMWGTEYKNLKHWAYPIKTYIEFETGREDEEKRIDPISSLLEGMARLKPGEQIWVQFRLLPVLDEYVSWTPAGKQLRDKLARRDVKEAKPKPMFQEAAEILITGKVPEPPKEEKKDFIPVEMKLTPVEKEIMSGVERKIGKLGFLTNFRFIYLAKRDVMFKPNSRLAMSYFTNFITDNMQSLVPAADTITKVKRNWYDWFWFLKRRLYLKKRRMFRSYVKRLWIGYPNPCVKAPDQSGGRRFVLTPDEIASMYHFPGRMQAPAPTMPRVEAKKGEPPSSLPVD